MRHLATVALLAIAFSFAVAAPAAANEDTDVAVTFTEHVAPIFMQSCVSCHRPKELAPMSLLSYAEARPWAKSIRKAVAEKTMPPWDAEPGPVKFANDISLDQDEIATIVAWVDQGAPEGDPSKMPEAPQFVEGWKLGEPDVVVDLPAYTVPADGEDLFPTILVNLDIPEDKYLSGIELQVDNANILHHLVLFEGVLSMSDEIVDHRAEDARKSNPMEIPSLLYVWAAGSPPGVFPEGVGRTLSKNPTLSLNFHYHPYGEAATDASKIGLYFTDEAPERELVTATTVNPSLMLPAGENDYSLKSYHLFPEDSRIVSMLPHMHQRGQAISYTLTYPDGQSERILDIPNYDFNWQWIYYLEEPKRVPAGTLLTVEGHWDNTADNPNNPDPSVDVRWGDGSNFEMLAGIIDFVSVDHKRPQRADYAQVVDTFLARHDPTASYIAKFGPMNFGLYLPRDGSGMMYVAESASTISTDLNELVWDGDRVVINSHFLRGAADSFPISLIAELGDDGSMSGEFFFGKHLTKETAAKSLGKGQKFSGRLVGGPPAAASSGGP